VESTNSCGGALNPLDETATELEVVIAIDTVEFEAGEGPGEGLKSNASIKSLAEASLEVSGGR